MTQRVRGPLQVRFADGLNDVCFFMTRCLNCVCCCVIELAENADLVIHEATNSYLAGIDKDTNLKMVTKDAVIHGHSTPYIAGDFANRVGAKRLVLNHFSARYKGDQSLESLSIMTRIEHQAIQASGLTHDKVAAAWDLMVLPIHQK